MLAIEQLISALSARDLGASIVNVESATIKSQSTASFSIPPNPLHSVHNTSPSRRKYGNLAADALPVNKNAAVLSIRDQLRHTRHQTWHGEGAVHHADLGRRGRDSGADEGHEGAQLGEEEMRALQGKLRPRA